MRRFRTRLLLPVLLALAVPHLACAHALLTSSSPRDRAVLTAAPKQVVLRFDARLEKSLTKVTLYDAKRNKIRLPQAKNGLTGGAPNQLTIPMPALKPGSYRLEYNVLATDGHLTQGVIRFTISRRKPA